VRRLSLAIVVACAWVGTTPIVASQSRTPWPAPTFTIRFAKTPAPPGCELQFFLRGVSGYGTVQEIAARETSVTIPTAHNGWPATSLKAVVHCPFFQIRLIDVPSLDESSREASVDFVPLPSVSLSGRVELADGRTINDVIIDVGYEPGWVCEFFVLMDCVVGPWPIAQVKASRDRTFSTTVPDFCSDPMLDRFSSRGAMWITAGHQKAPVTQYWTAQNPPVSRSYPVEIVLKPEGLARAAPVTMPDRSRSPQSSRGCTSALRIVN